MIVTQLNQEAEKMKGTGRGKLFKSAANEILELRQRIEELEAQQSEVAARAVEDAANEVPDWDCSCGAWLQARAENIRKGEGDE